MGPAWPALNDDGRVRTVEALRPVHGRAVRERIDLAELDLGRTKGRREQDDHRGDRRPDEGDQSHTQDLPVPVRGWVREVRAAPHARAAAAIVECRAGRRR